MIRVDCFVQVQQKNDACDNFRHGRRFCGGDLWKRLIHDIMYTLRGEGTKYSGVHSVYIMPDT